MSSTGEFPSFFKSLGTDSPRSRQKFCGMFCPVEGSADSKTLDLQGSQAAKKTPGDGRVIDRQTDISQPRKVEIHECKGKEALQNLDHKMSGYQGKKNIPRITSLGTAERCSARPLHSGESIEPTPPWVEQPSSGRV
ncbi:hypothetical protein NHX12_028099 [Muraenolepis orangiensis]|uniref:Uncharacterized protein n=1 Tax=Muraenolepis orangiensis TaxID=630683 RepID=A0A9Q0IR38_9TELE|nr:hypothetical protein NHX12_028099 [Muraenolepis orangiensis]